MTQSLRVVHFNPDSPKHLQLKDAMQSIQQKQNRETLSIWISIYSALKQARLDRSYTASEILLQSYHEGLILIEQGDSIENPTAWLRFACHRYIKALKHNHAKAYS
jgi:hypothetical protein